MGARSHIIIIIQNHITTFLKLLSIYTSHEPASVSQTLSRHPQTLHDTHFYLLEKHWKKRRKSNILILKHLLPIKVSSLPIFKACKFVSSALFFRVVWNQGEYSNCRKYATPQMLPVVNTQPPFFIQKLAPNSESGDARLKASLVYRAELAC